MDPAQRLFLCHQLSPSATVPVHTLEVRAETLGELEADRGGDVTTSHIHKVFLLSKKTERCQALMRLLLLSRFSRVQLCATP